MATPAKVYDVCDSVIIRVSEAGYGLNVLKLHKLLYYCQAWSLAFGEGRLFQGAFQAWVHGPVSRPIYDRYKDSKALYSSVTISDASSDFNPKSISKTGRSTISAVMESYAELSGDQLEEMTHRELPWQEARRGVPSNARSENLIDEATMEKYYRARIEKQTAKQK